MAKWAKIMFNDFINHFSTMDDKQIVKDVRSSIIALSTDSEKGKSFGAKMVHISNEWLKKFTPHQSAAGKRSWEVRKSMFVKTTAQNNNQVTTTHATTPTISANNVEPDNVKLDIGQLSQDADIRKDSEDRKSSTSCTFDTEARQDLRTGAAPERVKNQPSSHCGKAPVRSFGESGLVHMTDAQANSLRSYYGEDFDRAVGILENYILSLPSKAEGDEKGEATFWREDYAKRNHYFAMRRDNWVDNALKKAKTADKRLENASNPNYKSFKQQDIDARTEFFSKSIFDGKEAI
ncbi:MAG: hypothetical protein IKM81_07240 [Fibrobacter sp.]|nr:hypothetical protein [Fibrobacter sp.]